MRISDWSSDVCSSDLLDVRGAFPESITSTEDGGLILGSVGGGAIYRVAPGSSKAEHWIVPAAAGHSVFGVLADESRNTLWACTVVLGPADQAHSEFKRYNLSDGTPLDSYAVPRSEGRREVTQGDSKFSCRWSAYH